ncbi:LOW QUALITY PROTEIN: hypothetical protein PHPALM_29016 [Phytophthora palmivora]|uniref:Uncharacterized protein n=1 Tax=Phytophthora palmivora TaxID=4796 RepID=A0A2P4X8M6_9STRA|nr:LOW QUALITY PROTEIN: hypothetical protein PHPALM_29016 [Phytophthora palmivora]
MWKYLCDRTANEQTKSMTKRQLYAQLESARSKQIDNVERHLNYMTRLTGQRNVVGMTLNGAVRILVSFTEDTSNVRSVCGISTTIASRITGVGAVTMLNKIDGETVVTFIGV